MPIRDYLKFVAANLRFVTFGFFLAFGSSFGQTFFIGTFGPAIQMEFSLSHTSWGTIYMVGTLGSAALLPWTGKQIDRFDLRPYTALVCILLTIACGFTAFVTTGVMLVFAIFLLRQSGQGLMSHIAITSMARYFDRDRGRAVAIATLGFSTGEAFLPFLAVFAISVCGWRWAYGGIAILLAVGLIPCVFWLLRDYDKRHQAYLARINAPATPGGPFHRSWTRTEVLKDIRFYLLLPGILAPSLIVTAMFFHHLNLADAKNWSHAWITGSYVIYAAAAILTALASGPLIDRFGASRQVSIMLMPLTVAMIVIAEFSNPWIAWPYLILIGINVGVAHTAVSVMWAEIYGVAHLGAIKSLASALSVFASALGPVIAGTLMDLGVSIEQVCLIFSAYTVFGAVLIIVALTRPRVSVPKRFY